MKKQRDSLLSEPAPLRNLFISRKSYDTNTCLPDNWRVVQMGLPVLDFRL